MANQNIGILHPGQMGISVAASIQNSGYTVYWVSEGRSAESRERAEKFGLRDAASLKHLVETCPVIVSVCPPHATEEVAHQVLAHGFKGMYVEANAIAPQRAIRIGQHLEEAGVTFVDGGIVGARRQLDGLRHPEADLGRQTVGGLLVDHLGHGLRLGHQRRDEGRERGPVAVHQVDIRFADHQQEPGAMRLGQRLELADQRDFVPFAQDRDGAVARMQPDGPGLPAEADHLDPRAPEIAHHGKPDRAVDTKHDDRRFHGNAGLPRLLTATPPKLR